MYAVCVLDYIFAFEFGVLFQYFTIAPAWRTSRFSSPDSGVTLEVNSVEFWFMMQIAMLCGFATAYPVNRWLIVAGVKEEM